MAKSEKNQKGLEKDRGSVWAMKEKLVEALVETQSNYVRRPQRGRDFVKQNQQLAADKKVFKKRLVRTQRVLGEKKEILDDRS